MAFKVSGHFPSLKACVAHCEKSYRSTARILAKDISDTSGELKAVNSPAFLFRGETTNKHETCISTAVRLSQDLKLSQAEIEAIGQVVTFVANDLADFLKISHLEAWGFARHYECPTHSIDFTSEIEVAAQFAAEADVGTVGLMCVMEVNVAKNAAQIVDLRFSPGVVRAQKQSAFTVLSSKHWNFKDDEAIRNLGLTWFSFELQDSDVACFRNKRDMLDAHTDYVAGILQLTIDQFGKFDDTAAKWLAERVAAAPFISELATGKLVTLEQAGLKFDEKTERRNNYKVWSSKHPDTRASVQMSMLETGSR